MKTTTSFLLIGLICLNNYFLSAQNAPIATIGEVVNYSTAAEVPITVTGFSDISVCDLTLNYDPEIAIVTSVTLGPGVLQTFFVSDFEIPGTIALAWFYYQGITIPDDSVFISITFERIAYGYSAIEFDNSLPNNCLWGDVNAIELNDIPYSTYYIDGSIAFEMVNAPITSAPDIEACQGSISVDIPVTVSGFYQIGAFNLTMQYDPQAFVYQSFTNNSSFPDLEVIENTPGTIVIEGISDATEGVTLSNNSILFTVHFNNLGGSTGINWLDLGESCEYKGPAPDYELMNDNPQSSFYVNGSFIELPVPAEAGIITGPTGGVVCQGENEVTFSVSPILYADSYVWTLTEGATITSGENTHEIIVSFSDNAINGDVNVYGINECGNGIVSPSFPLIVELAPSISIQPVSPDTVYAGAGIATFSITATGSNLAFQWQEYTDDWSDVTDGGVYTGALTSLLTITDSPVSMDGNYYRCIVSGNCEPPAISDGNAILTVVVYTGLNINNFGNDYGNEELKFKSFPNPFSEQITFTYTPPSKGTVKIEITSIYGEKLAEIADQIEIKGDRLISFDARHLRPGIYMATITFKSDKGIISNVIKIISDK